MNARIMYIECKDVDGVGGAAARIGRVTCSKSGRTLYYRGHQFRSLRGQGFKANYYEVGTGHSYWISGCHHDGRDSLYPVPVTIDDDVYDEYVREYGAPRRRTRHSRRKRVTPQPAA